MFERAPSSSEILPKESAQCKRIGPVEQSLRQTGTGPEQPPGECFLPEIVSSFALTRTVVHTPMLTESQPTSRNETEFSVGVISKLSEPDISYNRQNIRTEPPYENSSRSASFKLSECMASRTTRCEKSSPVPGILAEKPSEKPTSFKSVNFETSNAVSTPNVQSSLPRQAEPTFELSLKETSCAVSRITTSGKFLPKPPCLPNEIDLFEDVSHEMSGFIQQKNGSVEQQSETNATAAEPVPPTGATELFPFSGGISNSSRCATVTHISTSDFSPKQSETYDGIDTSEPMRKSNQQNTDVRQAKVVPKLLSNNPTFSGVASLESIVALKNNNDNKDIGTQSSTKGIDYQVSIRRVSTIPFSSTA